VTFPFLPGGALVAIAALGTVLASFGLTMRLLDRAALELRGSMLPGMVEGLRDWADGQVRRPGVSGSISAGQRSSEPAIEDLALEPDLRLERVRRRRS